MQESHVMDVLRVAQKAAIAAADWNGRGDKVSADQAATTAMREAFNEMDFSGRIVIGEGERDEAPMLYIGEELGRGGEKIDIAVDPLEGTNLCAYNRPNALTTIAIAPRGGLLFAPDTYMNKIAAGPACKGLVHIDKSPEENVRAVAKALGKDVREVNVCILLRDRHEGLIQAVRETGARVRLIDDGDVFGAIATAVDHTGIDLYMGAGGSPEGVLACAGLKAVGGEFQGRFQWRTEEERQRALATAEVDVDGLLTMDDLVRTDDVAFIACGVTDGEMVKGVKITSDYVSTDAVVMSASSNSVQFIKTISRTGEGSISF